MRCRIIPGALHDFARIKVIVALFPAAAVAGDEPNPAQVDQMGQANLELATCTAASKSLPGNCERRALDARVTSARAVRQVGT